METFGKTNTVVTVIGTAFLLNRNIIRRSSGKDKQGYGPGRGTESNFGD